MIARMSSNGGGMDACKDCKSIEEEYVCRLRRMTEGNNEHVSSNNAKITQKTYRRRGAAEKQYHKFPSLQNVKSLHHGNGPSRTLLNDGASSFGLNVARTQWKCDK